MPNLSIKDVPEAWAQALRERAARNHRSLQGELMALIQGAVAPKTGAELSVNASNSPVTDSITRALAEGAPGPAGRRGAFVGMDRFGRPIIRQGWKTVEQVAAELKVKYPHGPGPDLGSSIDMIREDRDSR
jgi:plasmid stability protein